MKHIFTTALLFICLAPAYAGLTAHYGARTHALETLPMQEMHSQCIMTSGVKYSSFVYEPFNGAAPSEYTDGTNASGGPRRSKKWDGDGFIIGPDTPPGQESPIGEPWILAAFALLFAGVLAWRKRYKRRYGGATESPRTHLASSNTL